MTTEERYKAALERIASSLGCTICTNMAKEALTDPPEFEEVEVVRYFCTVCETLMEGSDELSCCCQYGEPKWIKLTGTYQRPVKKKVKRMEEIFVSSYTPTSVICRLDPQAALTDKSRYFREWEE